MKRIALLTLFLLAFCLSSHNGLADEKKLVITQAGAANIQEKTYMEESPDIEIIIRRVNDCSPGWVAQQIGSGDDITDLYVVRTNQTGYYDLISKGYCAELNSIVSLSSKLREMPRYVTDVISYNGSFSAVPEMIIPDSGNCVLCNTKHPLWQQYDLKNHHSSADILDMIDDLYQKNELDQWWLWDDHYDDLHLYNLCIVGSVSYMEAGGQMDLTDREYVNLFYHFDKARQRLLERSTPPEQDALFHTVNLVDTSFLINEDYELIMITPFPGQSEMLRLDMEVIVLNPHAPNKEEAITYLTHILEHYSQPESLFLYPSAEGSFADTSDEISGSDRPMTQTFVTRIKENSDVIRICTDSYLNLFWDEQGLSAEERYLSGYMSVEQYIEYLSKKLMMIVSEEK